MANPGEFGFSNVWAAPPTPGQLEGGFETPQRRRRLDPAEEQAQEEAEARRRLEESAESEANASTSRGKPRAERDLLVQMVQQMHQQSLAQNQLILDLQTRLDRMERDRTQGPLGAPLVAPPPPPTTENFVEDWISLGSLEFQHLVGISGRAVWVRSQVSGHGVNL